jgi:hypothetical protein
MATPQKELKPKPEWVSKIEAAKMLGVRERQVEKRAQQGWIQLRYLPRLPTERSRRVQYWRADIEALLAGTPNQYGEAVSSEPSAPEVRAPRPVALSVRPAPPHGTATAHAQVDFFAGLAVKLAGLSELALKYGPPQTKAWLTFSEAIEYSGHTPAKLGELLRTDQINNYGRGRGKRVSRASLDEYGKVGA